MGQFPTSTVGHTFQTRLLALLQTQSPVTRGHRQTFGDGRVAGDQLHPRPDLTGLGGASSPTPVSPGANAISAARTPANTICICHSPHPIRPEADMRRIVPKRRSERRLASLYGR